MSGYDIRQNLGISLGSLWAASYGQIYPTLHSLAADGLVSREDAGTGERERTVYHLTPAGRKAFRQWLLEPVDYPPSRDPFRFWASYLDVLPPAAAEAGIERHLERNRERLVYYRSVVAAIESGSHPMIRARSEQLTPEELTRLKATRAFVFRELALQAEFEIASTLRLRELARQLQESEADSAS